MIVMCYKEFLLKSVLLIQEIEIGEEEKVFVLFLILRVITLRDLNE